MDEIIKQLYQNKYKHNYDELSDLFDLNYQKITTLIPKLKETDSDLTVSLEKNPNLHLFFEQRTPYTGTYKLTHKFDKVFRPDIRFKVYFDAKLVEVLSVCDEETINNEHIFLASCSDVELKWETNNLLAHWLDYCLGKNYNF